MSRLLGVLIAFIALWMGLVGPSPAVATPTLSNSAHTYDTSHHTAQADHVVSSRAPPRKLFEAPTQSAEPGSRGAQARPSAAARYGSTNYDAPTSLAQSDNRTGTTTVSGSTIDAGLLSFQTTGVAAESGSALSRASQAAFRAADDPASIFVKNKHLASAGGNGAKFASDDIGQVQGWISRGLQSDGVQFLPNQLDDTFRAIVPGGGVVGTRGQEFIRVIVTGDGRVINAFPVKVR